MAKSFFGDRINELEQRYNESLAPFGVKVIIKHKNYEEAVDPYTSNHISGGSLINLFEYLLFSRKREKKYHKVSNRYNCLILQIQPLKSQATKKCDTKQYSFLLGKTERLHQGQDPEIMTVNAQRVLHRLECRLQKILNTAKKKQIKQWYNNDLGDAIRYTFMRRYGYLESYFGKARLFWDILLSSSFVVLFVLLIAGDYFLFH